MLAGDVEAAEPRRARSAGDRRLQGKPRSRRRERRRLLRARRRARRDRVLRARNEGMLLRGAAAVVGLSIDQLVAWGVLYYAYTVLSHPIAADLGVSRLYVAGAFSACLLTASWASRRVGASARPSWARAACSGSGRSSRRRSSPPSRWSKARRHLSSPSSRSGSPSRCRSTSRRSGRWSPGTRRSAPARARCSR